MTEKYKPKILLVNEFSELATGFSNYGKEIFKRLYNTGKYELAELGTYVRPDDPRLRIPPWKVYTSQPHPDDKQGMEEYNKQYQQWGRLMPLGQFGANVLDKVLLDFKPDFVMSIMDAWMVTPQCDTPLRKYFKWVLMPCVDSKPQREEWMKMYESADYLLGYSDFAINVLNEQSPKIKASGFKKLYPIPARPGVDMNTFKPLNKAETRAKWRLNPDLPIVLTTMRNQARKLFCEILDSFAKYKKDNKDDPIAQKAVFLIHSSGYDAGQEYWLHIKRITADTWEPYHLPNFHQHILHTFMCDKCGSKHIDFAIKLLNPRWENGRPYIQCASCGEWAARTPNTNVGFTREEMAEVFNLADLYVQCSIAGADEMPATEAKACGVPVLASAYAALEEKTTKIKEKNSDGTPYSMHLGGVPIKISHYFVEAATMQTRAYFDRNDLAKKFELLSKTDKLKKLGEDALIAVKENCDYEQIVKKWEYVFDNLPIKDRSTTWERVLTEEEFPLMGQISIPTLSDQDFVDWCYVNILKTEVDKVGRETWIRDLSTGRPRQEIVEYFVKVATKDKQAEYILANYRQYLLQVEEMRKIQSNPDLLRGILCQ